MMALVGVELETLVSEPDALTTRSLPCASNYQVAQANVSNLVGSAC